MAIAATALLAPLLVVCLPESPYTRYKQLDNTEYRNLRWIYERTHFDPEGIDIAIIGSSRIATGVDGRMLSRRLRAAGLDLRVVNFGIPFNGRDLDLEITRELLAMKRPRLLIIGVPEHPSYHTHVIYKYIANSRDLIGSLRYGNIDYFSDLFYLPYRHLRIAWSAISPTSPETINQNYEDPVAHAETAFKREPDGHWQASYPQRGLDVLESGAKRALVQGGGKSGPAMPWIADWSAEQLNIAAITDLAKVNHAKVIFLFIPQFLSDGTISDREFYKRHGPLLDASFLSMHSEYYSSWGHLNAQGARVLDAWLLRELIAKKTILKSGGERKVLIVARSRPYYAARKTDDTS
jgi:hypothetical protein